MSDDTPEKALEECLREAARKRAAAWKVSSTNEVRQGKKRRHDFENALEQQVWGVALDRLERFRLRCVHVAERYVRRQAHYGREGEADPNYRFEATRLLFRRASLVTSEIYVLLRAGHASGGLARWRTLFEVGVIASFIQDNDDQSLALRYLNHRFVAHADAADRGLLTENALVPAVTDPKVIVVSRARREELINEHGREYRADYGWAAANIPAAMRADASKVTLNDLANAAQAQAAHQYVGLANLSTHGGAMASFWDPGRPKEWPRAPSGPTDVGLGIAGHATAPALLLATDAFMSIRRDMDTEIDTRALLVLAQECRDVFVRAEQALNQFGVQAAPQPNEADSDDPPSG